MADQPAIQQPQPAMQQPPSLLLKMCGITAVDPAGDNVFSASDHFIDILDDGTLEALRLVCRSVSRSRAVFSGFYRNIQLRTPMEETNGQSRLICELPRGAAQLVRAAAFRVDVYDRRAEDAALKRQRKKEQALVASRLQGLRELTFEVVVGNWNGPLLALENLADTLDETCRDIAAMMSRLRGKTSRVIARFSFYERSSGIVNEVLSSLLDPLSAGRHLSLDFGNLPINAVLQSRLYPAQVLERLGQAVRSVETADESWTDLLLAIGLLPNIETIQCEPRFDSPGLHAMSLLRVLGNCGPRLAKIDFGRTVPGPDVSQSGPPLPLHHLQLVALDRDAFDVLRHTIKSVHCKHLVLDGIAGVDLPTIGAMLSDGDAFIGLRQLNVQYARNEHTTAWTEDVMEFSRIKALASARGCIFVTRISYWPPPVAAGEPDYTLESLLGFLSQFCENIEYLGLQLPDARGQCQSSSIPAHITLSRCTKVEFQMLDRPPSFDNLDHFYELMRLIEVPKADTFDLVIKSGWGQSLKIVTNAIRRGAWPSLSRITGNYTIYTTDRDIWALGHTAGVRADFLAACHEAGIQVDLDIWREEPAAHEAADGSF